MGKKPFFYRIDASELLQEVMSIKSDKERGIFIKQFSIDLVTGSATSSYATKVIEEAVEFINKKKSAGSKGGKQKASSAKAVLKQRSSTPLASSSSSSSSSSNTETKEKNKRFVPPSVSEVEAYMKEIGFDSDAEYFVDSNTAKGWLVGSNKTPAKDWKAVVRTWRALDKKRNPPKQETKPQLKYGDPGYVTDQRKLAL